MTAAAAISVWGMAAAAISLGVSQPPLYWPAITGLIPHLPTLHSLVSSTTRWLLRNAHI